MRILMLTSSWPLYDGDFRGVFVQELALELASRGICVDVAVPAPPGAVEPRNLAGGSVVVHWLPSKLPLRSLAFHGNGIENNLVRHPASAFSLTPALAAFAAECSVMLPFVDAIVSNWLLPMGGVGALLAAMSGRPHLVIAHSGPPAPATIPPLSLAVRKIVESAFSVACVSDAVRKRVSAAAPGIPDDRLPVIPLGVGLRPFVQAGDRVAKGLNVLFVGRLVPIKGLDLLIRAMRGLDEVRLTVVGDGPVRGSMESLARLLSVDVEFCGSATPDEVRTRMCGADVLVVPSRRGLLGREEGMPRVIGEAWSVGLPVVASRSGGMESAIVSTGAGRLFEPGDVGSLRAVLACLDTDRQSVVAMRDMALAAASALSWDTAGSLWAGWIESALNAGG